MSNLPTRTYSQRDKAILLAKAAKRIKEIQEAEKYENSLVEFAAYVWPVVEPAIPFVRGWVIDAVAEHLEAVTHGYIKRLLINVPPGFMKSLLTDVFWPAWEWGPRNMPHLRYVCASYSDRLTIRDNLRCRNIITSDRYKRLWGNRFKPALDQFEKIKFANDKTGWKLATSVGGIGTGERGDRFVIDDANNTMEMESDAIRFSTNMWFTEVVPDRLNSMQNSAIVVIQQRLHEEDVSGVALSRDMGYTHLNIPMEYESDRHCVTVLGLDEKTGEEITWEDPRSHEGELAWAERFPPSACERLKKDKGPWAWAGQYQQRPTPRGGGILKSEWWKPWDEDTAAKNGVKPDTYPACDFILASLDTAYTEKEENDPSALSIWGVWRDPVGNPNVMLMLSWQERLQFHELVMRVGADCKRFRVDRILIEDKAAGHSVSQELRRLFGSFDFGIQLFNPREYGDKVARAHAVVHLFSEGLIYAPAKQWAQEMIDNCAIFPRGTHDDLVDSCTQALIWLRKNSLALRREEHALEVADEMRFRPRSMPLYPA